jgi:hypothetical protein
VTWQPGRDKIAELLAAAEPQQVSDDRRIAQLLLDDASRHLATAAVALPSGDLSGAYQLAYASTVATAADHQQPGKRAGTPQSPRGRAQPAAAMTRAVSPAAGKCALSAAVWRVVAACGVGLAMD